MNSRTSRRAFCGFSLIALAKASLLADEVPSNALRRNLFPVFGAFGPLNDPNRFGPITETEHCLLRCNTNEGDAHTVIGEFTDVWNQIGALADPWTNVHRRPAEPSPQYPEFEVGPVGVFVDRHPLNEYRAAPTSLQLVGNATMIYLNVGPGQLSLQKQLARLRLATAHAFLCETRLAEQLPPWVSDGLAGYVARFGLEDPQQAALQVDGIIAFRGENRRQKRGPWAIRPGIDEYEQQAVDRFQFLLEGNDAEYTWELIDALQKAAEQPLPRFTTRLREKSLPAYLDPSRYPTPVDVLMENHQEGLKAWKENPKAGQPIYECEQQVNDKQFEKQLEMMLILKLAKRFPLPLKRPAGVRVVEFGQGAARPFTLRGDDTPPAAITLEMLRRRLLDPTAPRWATVDADGSVLLSTNRERIGSLLNNRDGRYQVAVRDGRWILSYRWDRAATLEGRLEKNPEDPQRPLAKMSLLARPT